MVSWAGEFTSPAGTGGSDEFSGEDEKCEECTTPGGGSAGGRIFCS